MGIVRVDDTTAEQKRERFGKLISVYQGEMTTAELAKAVGLSRNQMYLLKDGQSGTSPDTVRRFVQVFRLTDPEAIGELYRLAGFAPPDTFEGPAYNPDLVELGRRMRQQRECMKYTLADMGRLLGMTGEGYGYYERGERPITVTNLRKVARKLKTTVAALIGEMEERAEAEEELLNAYRIASPQVQDVARKMLTAVVREERAEAVSGKGAEVGTG